MMIIDGNAMCVPQQTQKVATKTPYDACESSVSVHEDVVDPIGDQDEAEAEAGFPPQELMYPEKSLPVTPRSPTKRKSKKTTKKSVRFDQSVIAMPCLHRNNYTDREAAASWYGNREFERIRRELLKTLSLMYAGKFVECDETDEVLSEGSSNSLDTASTNSTCASNQRCKLSSSRGLEGYTVKGSLRSHIRKLRQKAITDVLVEQDFQVDRAEAMKLTYLFYDDNAIRKVYEKHSKIALEVARKKAIEDHRVAIGAPKETAPPTTTGKMTRRQSLLNLFSKKTTTKNVGKPSRQRRWSSSENSLIEAAAMAMSAEQNTKQQRRWSSKEDNLMEAAIMATKQTKNKQRRQSWSSNSLLKGIGNSEKKLNTKNQLWSIINPKSSKPQTLATFVA